MWSCASFRRDSSLRTNSNAEAVNMLQSLFLTIDYHVKRTWACIWHERHQKDNRKCPPVVLMHGDAGGRSLNDDMDAIQGFQAIREGPQKVKFGGYSSPTRLCHQVLDEIVPDGVTYSSDACHSAESLSQLKTAEWKESLVGKYLQKVSLYKYQNYDIYIVSYCVSQKLSHWH